MPVTARLSKRFYDAFGDDIVNELVTWFNDVDATYRGDLRELNDLNFARFDAKMGQRLAEQDARIDARVTALEVKWEARFSELELRMETRFTAADARFDGLDGRCDRIETRLGALEKRMDAQFRETAERMDRQFSETSDKFAAVNVRLAGLKSELQAWMFLFWIGTVGAAWLLR